MSGRTCLVLPSMALIAVVSTPVQAALIAEWLLDENPITTDVTVASDTTGNWNGTYKDSAFFGAGDAISVTGHTGVANTAVQFTKDQYVEIASPADPNDPNDLGGVFPRDPHGFMYEMWLRFDGQILGSQFAENAPDVDGPNVSLKMIGGELYSLVASGASGWGGDVPGSLAPRVAPPGGFDFEQWYYIGFVLDTEVTGTSWIYVSDGTEVWSHSQARNTGLITGEGPRLRINGNYVTGGGDYTIDNVRIFDLAFDPNSDLVQVFGIPEPTSLAALVLGGLLLARRRRGAQFRGGSKGA